jgi:hypothetical protein
MRFHCDHEGICPLLESSNRFAFCKGRDANRRKVIEAQATRCRSRPTRSRPDRWPYSRAHHLALPTVREAVRRAGKRHRPQDRRGSRETSKPARRPARAARSSGCDGSRGPSGPFSFVPENKNPALAGPLRGGRYWARTSDPQLVESSTRLDAVGQAWTDAVKSASCWFYARLGWPCSDSFC